MRHKAKDHKMETRKREIGESFCIQPGCKYKGERAVQGHCFHRLDDASQKYIRAVMKRGEGFLEEMRAMRGVNHWKTKATWTKALEGHMVGSWMNSEFTMDELIHLRCEVEGLRRRLGRMKAK